MSCRICSAEVLPVVDLGAMPPANRLKESLNLEENDYPLALEYCQSCKNLQIGYCVPEDELYDSYLYVTPDSPSLSAHYNRIITYMKHAGYLSSATFMVEFGSNIGRFLQTAKPHVKRTLGVDPAQNVCDMASNQGVETRCAYFGAAEGRAILQIAGPADLIVARHCAAHNKDPHALINGVTSLLADEGVFVMENAYGLTTIIEREFGQIYHEHMFYFTAQAVQRLLKLHGLRLIDILMAPVHGGSIVFFAAREDSSYPIRPSVEATLRHEATLLTNKALETFADDIAAKKRDIVPFVRQLVKEGADIWLYGASAKASTFVNYLGLTAVDIPYCIDSTPIKQGRYMPKSNILIRSEEDTITVKPDYFLITAWNYKDEIINKTRASGNTRSKFIVPHPQLSVVR